MREDRGAAGLHSSIPKGFQPIAGGQRSATTGKDAQRRVPIPAGIAAVGRSDDSWSIKIVR